MAFITDWVAHSDLIKFLQELFQVDPEFSLLGPAEEVQGAGWFNVIPASTTGATQSPESKGSVTAAT